MRRSVGLWRELRALFARMRGLFDRARADEEFAEEIASAIELHVDEGIRAGLSPQAARRQAHLKFGSVDAAREQQRDARGFVALDTLWQDTRHAWRTLRRRPAFTASCLATIALGLGATITMFAILDGIVLRPLPFPNADRLVVVHEVVPSLGEQVPLLTVSASHYTTWRERLSAFESSAAIEYASENLTGAGAPERLDCAVATPELFDVLGVRAQMGRTFTAEDGHPGSNNVAVISDGLWRRRFNADPEAIGRVIHLNGRPLTVIGVMPPDFQLASQSDVGVLVGRGTRSTDLIRPLTFARAQLTYEGMYNYAVIAGLREGWTRPQALAALNALQRDLTRTMGAPRGLQASISPLREFMARDVRAGLWLLMTAVGAVLLIICVNLANLLLARNARRRPEFALRAALGGGRGRLLRQLLAESVLLALAGGVVGLLGAWVGLRTLLAHVPVDLPRTAEVTIGPRVMLFAIAVSLLAGCAFGLLPALRLYGVSIGELLKGDGHAGSVAPRGGKRLRTLLIAGQVALCAVLLATSGLLLGSFARVQALDKGFDVTQRVSFDLMLPVTRYTSRRAVVQFHDRLLEQMRALPGVQDAAIVETVPLGLTANVNVVSRPGDVRPKLERPSAHFTFVSATYFDTMGIPLLRGRLFDARDRQTAADGHHVAVVSARAARTLWPGQDPIGQIFHEGDLVDPKTEVIGIVADIRGARLEQEAGPMIYTPHWQRAYPETSIVVKTTRPAAFAAMVRDELRRLDPQLPAPAIRTLDAIVADATSHRRFQLTAVTLFAAAAMLLASLGIFGVISHIVAQRTREIGVRMALGAQAGDLRRLVLEEGLRPVAAGLVAGVLMALATGHALRALLFGVSPFDPTILAAAIAPLLLCALAACYLPARRATRIDPLTALRSE